MCLSSNVQEITFKTLKLRGVFAFTDSLESCTIGQRNFKVTYEKGVPIWPGNLSPWKNWKRRWI